MKKMFIPLLIVLLISPLVLAINISVEKESSDEFLIADIGQSIKFDLNVTNHGDSDSFYFYNLIGFTMIPSEKIAIGKGKTKEITLEIAPIGKIVQRGSYTFQYFIKGSDSDTEEKLTFKILDLKDAFEIGVIEIKSELNSVDIYVENKVDIAFNDINAKFNSAFFNFEKIFSLDEKERKEFTIELNKEDFKKLMAGFYTMNTEIDVNGQKANIESTIKFTEKDIVTTTKKDYGILINTQIIKKSNEGNVMAPSESVLKKNIISRLFTTFNPEPDIVERDGTVIYYTWNQEIKPGQVVEIKVKTNWFFPLLAIIFIVAIIILIKKYSKTNLVMRKKVSFVKTKGGEFALKVSIRINAKKYVERVNIIDKLPMLAKVHERFGGEQPTRVDEKNKRIEWNFEKLEVGETRIISYIIYSKIGVIGKFALPEASAIYEREGKIEETQSNRAFFMTEPREREVEE